MDTPDALTVGVSALVAIGAAIGGYFSAPKKNTYCDFHEAMKTRLVTGDQKFSSIEKAAADARDAAQAAEQAASEAAVRGDMQITALGEMQKELTEHGKFIARIDERTKNMERSLLRGRNGNE